MSRYNRFIFHFAASFLVLSLLLLGFVTWMDPFRNLNCPWAVSFISDRNIAYKKFKLLEATPGVTDLIIGSSTSEAFVPQVLSERMKVHAFTASTGGASLPLRYLLIQQALKTQPKLKRIIYVADLFEFFEPRLDTSVYYQPEMMRALDTDLYRKVRPEWSLRFNDYFSFVVIDRSFRTLKDLQAEKKGSYHSSYHSDGSTTRSMIGGREGATLATRVHASALGMRSVYGKMEGLDPTAIQIFGRILRLIESYPGVDLHLVITPFHESFFDYFKAHFDTTGVYSKWVTFLRGTTSKRVIVHDFSYPVYVQSDIGLEDRFWQDGVHFTSEAMLKMAQQIYGEAK